MAAYFWVWRKVWLWELKLDLWREGLLPPNIGFYTVLSFALELIFWVERVIPPPILEPDLDLRSSGFLKYLSDESTWVQLFLSA